MNIEAPAQLEPHSAPAGAAVPCAGRSSCEARFMCLFLTHETRACAHRKGDARVDALEAELVSLMLCTGALR